MATRRKASAGPSIENGRFPEFSLPIAPPYPPMEAERREVIPKGDRWQYEPKWDGFRAVVFREGDTLAIQSKSGQPLARYFPELVRAFLELPQKQFVLDGEIVISIGGRLSFDDLLLRLHPAKSRIDKLSLETPAQFFAFDLLVEPARGEKVLASEPLSSRRERLERFFESVPESLPIKLSPATTDFKVAKSWFEDFGPIGLDGVMAKLREEPYHSGDRAGMVKIKQFKSAECVVGGFRYGTGTKSISTLLLGLYDEKGKLNHVGHAASFTAKQRPELDAMLQPLAGGAGFSGSAPGGPSRWSTERSGDWTAVDPVLVCEVRYDYFTQGRFRHGTKFERWRPEKDPKSCTYDQVLPTKKAAKKKLESIF